MGVNIDREWLGSAKEFIMPSSGGQMHEPNVDALNDNGGEGTSHSDDLERGRSVHEAPPRKDSARSGFTIDV